MKDSIWLFLLILFDVIAIGNICFWYCKMKGKGYRFCYTAPVGRAVIDVLLVVLIVLGEIYCIFSGETNRVLAVIMLFCVYGLPPRRYVFLGELGIYIGRRYFSLQDQLEGQLISNYPFHKGRIKIYCIHAEQKNSELVLLSLKKLKMVWKERES